MTRTAALLCFMFLCGPALADDVADPAAKESAAEDSMLGMLTMKAGAEASESDRGYMKSMQAMQQTLMKTEMSGNASGDFVRVMIPHHQIAIDMIDVLLAEKDGKAVEFPADKILVAVGRRPFTDSLGLEAAGVQLDEKRRVKVDGHLRTNVPGIYAIGDVAGPPMLAHKAEHEGVICVEGIKGLHVHPMDKAKIPGCTYCNPQIASVGLTEAKAKEQGRAIKVGRFPFQGNGKAIALGEPEGLIKTVFDAKTGELLGAHMIGPEVTEMIQGYAIAREAARRGATVTLVSTVELPVPAGVEVVPVETAAQMQAALESRAAACDVVVMSAAVADFRPVTSAVPCHLTPATSPGKLCILQIS